MNSAQMPKRVEEIFNQAIEITDAAERSEFLSKQCGDDAELRREIEQLLQLDSDAGSFLEKSPAELTPLADSVAGSSPNTATWPTGEHSNEAWQALLEPSENPDLLGTLHGYEIMELVGRGGMGIVLRALDPKLSRVAAVKLLAPEMASNATAVQRFLREARAAAAVSHDHVVSIYAVDDQSQPPLIAMEMIEGKSLQQKIDDEGALDLKSILRIGMQTAYGLEAAHRQGLVHRDIKPANILLENGVERVKLTDFGLARAIDDIGMTQTGQITGPPQYMSPEQAQGQRVDHRTDLFSLGCVLYAMCAGRAAFRADSAVAVMHCIVHDTPKPIHEHNEDIPNWLCNIADKLLAKDPAERFESSAEVAELLEGHLSHIQQPDSVPQPKPIAPRKKGSPLKSAASNNIWLAQMTLVLALTLFGATVAAGVTMIGERAIGMSTPLLLALAVLAIVGRTYRHFRKRPHDGWLPLLPLFTLPFLTIAFERTSNELVNSGNASATATTLSLVYSVPLLHLMRQRLGGWLRSIVVITTCFTLSVYGHWRGPAIADLVEGVGCVKVTNQHFSIPLLVSKDGKQVLETNPRKSSYLQFRVPEGDYQMTFAGEPLIDFEWQHQRRTPFTAQPSIHKMTEIVPKRRWQISVVAGHESILTLSSDASKQSNEPKPESVSAYKLADAVEDPNLADITHHVGLAHG